MKAIYGSIDLSKKWKLTETSCNDYPTTCDNCGTLIRNVATIKNVEGNLKYIGLDCAEKITSLEPDEVLQAIKEIRKKTKLIKFLKKDCKTIVMNTHFIWLYDYHTEKWASSWKYRLTKDRYLKVIDMFKNIQIIVEVK